MAFKREFLKAIGLSEEQISAAMEEHTNVTKYLQGQIDQYKADADKYKADAESLPGVQKELDELKSRKDYKADYDKAVQDLADYKAQIAKDAVAAKVRVAFKQLLTDESIDEKYHDVILKVTDFSGMKLGEDEKLQDADKLREGIGKEWGKFRVSVRERGENVAHPPRVSNGGGENTEMQMYAKRFHDERYGKKE